MTLTPHSWDSGKCQQSLITKQTILLNLSSLMLDVEATTRGLMLKIMYDDDENE